MRFEQLHVLKALGDLVTELPQKLLEGHMQDMLLSRGDTGVCNHALRSAYTETSKLVRTPP